MSSLSVILFKIARATLLFCTAVSLTLSWGLPVYWALLVQIPVGFALGGLTFVLCAAFPRLNELYMATFTPAQVQSLAEDKAALKIALKMLAEVRAEAKVKAEAEAKAEAKAKVKAEVKS